MRDSPVLKYYGGSCEGFYGDGGHRESETEWLWGPLVCQAAYSSVSWDLVEKGKRSPQMLRPSGKSFHVSFLKS